MTNAARLMAMNIAPAAKASLAPPGVVSAQTKAMTMAVKTRLNSPAIGDADHQAIAVPMAAVESKMPANDRLGLWLHIAAS